MPTRIIHHGDAFTWLAANTLGATHAVVTSLPDASELPSLSYQDWRTWFSQTSAQLCQATHPDAVTLFFQTDVKREGTWVDKAYLVQRGAEAAGSALLWHKVVCRAPAGTATFGRPAYAHLLAFSHRLRVEMGRSTADVVPHLGKMPWARAMGVGACQVACRFIAEQTPCRVVVDPFCGVGTVLAVAERFGLDSIGVELSKKRAERAQRLQLAASDDGQFRYQRLVARAEDVGEEQ